MPAHALAELDAIAGPAGKAHTDTLAGLHVVLDRSGPEEHRLAFGMRGDFPKRQIIERALRSLPPLPATAQRRTRYAGELRIIEYRWPAPGSQPALEDVPGRGEPTCSPLPSPPPASGPEQPPLLILPPLPPVNPIPDLDDGIDGRFARFHAANPHIYAALRDMAVSLAAAGETRIGVKMLWEVLRYRYLIAVSVGNEPYQLNNSFTSRYARLLNQEPGLAGKIELRKHRGPGEVPHGTTHGPLHDGAVERAAGADWGGHRWRMMSPPDAEFKHPGSTISPKTNAGHPRLGDDRHSPGWRRTTPSAPGSSRSRRSS